MFFHHRFPCVTTRYSHLVSLALGLTDIQRIRVYILNILTFVDIDTYWDALKNVIVINWQFFYRESNKTICESFSPIKLLEQMGENSRCFQSLKNIAHVYIVSITQIPCVMLRCGWIILTTITFLWLVLTMTHMSIYLRPISMIFNLMVMREWSVKYQHSVNHILIFLASDPPLREHYSNFFIIQGAFVYCLLSIEFKI